MDLLSLLKQANIFSPTGVDAQQQFPVGSVGGPINPQSGPVQPQTPDIISAIQGLLQPSNQQFNNYQQMIGSMPQRQDYQPDLLRRIGATLAGMGTGSPVGVSGGAVLGYKSNIPEGLKVQGAIKDEPYNQALTDWATKLEPTGKAAQMEQTRNVGDRQTALGILQRKQQEDKLAETEREARAKEEDRDLDRAVREKRAEAYIKAKEFEQTHPDYKAVTDEKGDLYFWNPKDPTADPVPSGLKQLTEIEKIDHKVEGTMKEIAARGKESRTTEGVRQANRKELEGVRQINRIGLKETPSGNALISKPLTPSASATDKTNKAIEIINARPELRSYFVIGGNGKPTGELKIPKSGDPTDSEFIRGQMGAGDIKLPSSQPSTSRELTRPSTGNDLIVKGTKVGNDPNRDEAINLLRKEGKPLTEANIEYIRKQLEKK